MIAGGRCVIHVLSFVMEKYSAPDDHYASSYLLEWNLVKDRTFQYK